MTTETEEAAPETGAEETDVVQTENGQDNDIETLARELGWKSEDEWKGDPPDGGFASAADFLRSQGSHSKNLKKQLDKLERETQRKIERIEKRAKEKAEKEAEERIEAIHQEYDILLRKAVKAGDEEQAAKIVRAKEQALKDAQGGEDEEEDEAEPGAFEGVSDEQFVETFEPSYPRLQKSFWNKHAWVLNEDSEEADEALQLAVDYMNSGVPMTEALEKAEASFSKSFADRYDTEEDDMDEEEVETAPTPKKRVPVLAPGGRRGGATGSLVSRMTPEQHKIAERNIKDGLYGSKEEWAKIRFAGEE